MKSGRVLALLSGIVTILGTYVFALFGVTGIVGSGIGYITNLGTLFGNAGAIAAGLWGDPALAWVVYVILILFILFLAAGVLQIVGMANRAISFIFSLFPLAIGVIIFLQAYTYVLGDASFFFTLFFLHEQVANIYPFLIPLGSMLVPLGDLGLGPYVLVAGGALGIIGTFLPRD